MEKNIKKYPNLKEIEQTVWRQLQDTYSVVMQKILQELDQEIAQERDKKRFRLIEKRSLSIDSLFILLNREKDKEVIEKIKNILLEWEE